MFKEYLKDLEKEFQNNAWEILVGLSLIIIFAIWITNKDKGTYSNHYIYHGGHPQTKVQYHEKAVNESKGEAVTRNVLQKIFRRPFISIRPDFLYNDVTGHNLEIDCYNDELKLGVEYNGRQHEKYTKFFHKNYDDFKMQKYRDLIKEFKCKERGITLISIPSNVPYNKIEDYLRTKLRSHGYYI